MNGIKRSGFDRRIGSDRRLIYSLDFYAEGIADRRQVKERRTEKEKRSNWSRVAKWASVPFHCDTKEGAVHIFLEAKIQDLRETAHALLDEKIPQSNDYVTDEVLNSAKIEFTTRGDIKRLNTILSSLVTYYENHIQQGQTDWFQDLDKMTFERARTVMRNLLEIPLKGQEEKCGPETSASQGMAKTPKNGLVKRKKRRMASILNDINIMRRRQPLVV